MRWKAEEVHSIIPGTDLRSLGSELRSHVGHDSGSGSDGADGGANGAEDGPVDVAEMVDNVTTVEKEEAV